MRWVLPLAMLAVGSPAFAADQFNLVCQGNKWVKRGGEPAPTTVRLRVDVAAKKWCQDECKTVSNMVAVEGDKLIFTDDSVVNTRMELIRHISFDRKTEFFIHNFSQVRPDEEILYISAVCDTEPFTPFPG